ncbi:MAG: 2-hydroxyglutaryl-CoA dehydratase [Deltaproteobacteria bacterium]|nr:2-hydroxyglutaryl-CoA dehydratase [Deltaproteobacteria bacterium]MBW1818618.1 2-hydroxyglutaryl-CoA dehydratase [Deltaproteobacteria bacterium]MBW2283216.1 2-hydroxyglutaryl-CoA dehydratase [Deltaproteobacteria bacterium]
MEQKITKEAAVGVDIGSLTAKSVVVDRDRRIVSYHVVQGTIVDEQAAVASLDRALRDAGLEKEQIGFLVTTGYGRTMVDFGDKNITEISCHARGANFLMPDARTVIDIGGQDSKVIAMDPSGKVANFSMNDKCAAGTGRFIEVMAHALDVPLDRMGSLSLTSDDPAAISSMCTVFAESEVISLSAKGRSKPDIIAGIHEAIGRRMKSLANHVGLAAPVLMSGGVAKNAGVVRVLERLLGTPIAVPEEPQIVGALGAALYALDEIEKERVKERRHNDE